MQGRANMFKIFKKWRELSNTADVKAKRITLLEKKHFQNQKDWFPSPFFQKIWLMKPYLCEKIVNLVPK